jgi:hypothetical protein
MLILKDGKVTVLKQDGKQDKTDYCEFSTWMKDSESLLVGTYGSV